MMQRENIPEETQILTGVESTDQNVSPPGMKDQSHALLFLLLMYWRNSVITGSYSGFQSLTEINSKKVCMCVHVHVHTHKCIHISVI